MFESPRRAFVCLALLGPAVHATGDETEAVVQGELGAELDAAVRDAGGADFWGAVLVARGGEVLLAQGYGFADYGDEPNTPATLFELASASKQIAAAAILRLEQKGKLAVTDTLDAFFDDVPEDKRGIQLHHLLTHTSGLSGRVGVPYASTLSRDRYVERMLATELVAAPGEAYEYCNVGYALLAAVVEEVSKQDFERYVEKELFKRAGMKDSGFIGDRDLVRSRRNSVRRTESTGEAGEWTASDWHWGWGYRGMGGVVSTVHDLLRWDRALRGDAVLGEEAKARLYTPYKAGYAYGWQVDVTDRGTRKVHHSGGVAGYGVNVVRYLEDDVCLFVLSNDGGAAHAVTGALERLLFEPVELAVTIDHGPYDLGESRIVKLPAELSWRALRREGRLVLQLLDADHAPLEVRAPLLFAARLRTQLEQAIAAREADDDGGPPAFEAGLYLQRYRSSPRVELSEDLEVAIEPAYYGVDESGQRVVDRRVLFVVRDPRNGMWPCLAKMNVAAARQLLAELAGVLE